MSALRVVGFTFARNAMRLAYPLIESLRSMLPLVDALHIAIGDSDDDTRAQVEALGDARIRIIDTRWDESSREGGRLLAEQTNVALDACEGDWGLYLQADECLDARDYSAIRVSLERAHARADIDGLLFNYTHFYGAANVLARGRQWYRHEVRAVRLGRGVRSWGDAQGFRREGRKLRVLDAGATVYHYGHARPLEAYLAKMQVFRPLYGEPPDSRPADLRHVYPRQLGLEPYMGTHPAIMEEWLRAHPTGLTLDDLRAPSTLANLPLRALMRIERALDHRFGEYRNYVLAD